jgi:hypothetical protein
VTIHTRYIVQCLPCERYLGCSRPAITNSSDSPLFLTYSSAYHEAVRCGWSAYPLICPDCAADLAQRVKEGPDGQQDRRPVPEPGQSPQRP